MGNRSEKIVYGSSLTVFSFNGNAKIPILYGGHVLTTQRTEYLLTEYNNFLRTEEEITSINIMLENADSTHQMTYSFPLEEGQILSGFDYIDSDGLHIDGETIAFTSQQEEAYEALQDISLFEGISHIIVTDATPAVLKLIYTSDEERDDRIYVLDKTEELIAVFDKDDTETLINPRIEKTQNSESIFTFTIDIQNSKWKQISNPENLYLINGMIFSTNFDGSFTEKISENDEKTMEVTAYERQQLLSRRYVRAWNSETGLEKIDTFMVVILSNGNLSLKNNGHVVTTTYPKGSSGYVLEGLLYGSGWTVGVCDVYEYENGQIVRDENNDPVYSKFDFETDQMNIYENILKVQELWGGILVFDSLNKIVHHRSEHVYLPYNGYEVKYEKNMQSLEKKYNNKIITKLCPLGEGGLNIKSVNNDSVWLQNYTYTNTVLEGIENNPDITNPLQLKRWGQRKLEELCKPSIELDVNIALLYQVEGHELESIDLNDIVLVIDYEEALPTIFASQNTIIGENTIIGGISFKQLRIIEFSYSVWDKSDTKIKLSNIILDSIDVFKKTIAATESINTGTLNASRVATLYNGGESVETTMANMNTAVSTKVGNDEVVSKLNSAIENGQGIINITGNQVTIESDNFELDAEGNVTMRNATITGGKLEVNGFDDNETVINLTNFTVPSMGQGIQTGVEISSEGIEIYKETFVQGETTSKISTKILANNQRVLWSGGTGGYYMTDAHTISLNENISNQNNGIILVWSDYSNGQANDWGFNFTFVPKKFLDLGLSGNGIVCQLATGKFNTIATKYVYISDSSISGDADNTATGTTNGITYANNRFVLRRVIGV